MSAEEISRAVLQMDEGTQQNAAMVEQASAAAASMNHFISAICWSFDRVDGWNSLSIHFFAAVSDAATGAGAVAAAGAGAVVAAGAGAVAAALGSSFLPQADSISTTAPTAESEYIESERFMIDFLEYFPLSGETHRLGRWAGGRTKNTLSLCA